MLKVGVATAEKKVSTHLDEQIDGHLENLDPVSIGRFDNMLCVI